MNTQPHHHHTPNHCQKCGVSITPITSNIFGTNFTLEPTLCESCEAAELKRLHDEEEQKKQAECVERFRQSVPSRYRVTSPKKPSFNQKLWKTVSQWQPTEEIPWLGIHGPSGRCKTRCAILRGGKFANSGQEPFYVPGREFERWAKFLFSEDSEKYRLLLQRANHCRVLIFDDIGKIKPTPAVVGALFDLLEHRHSHNLTTIWTANRSPEDITENYDEEFAGPIEGRLCESSFIVSL